MGWYYLASSGEKVSGWIKDTNGKYYYLSNDNGVMLTSTVTPDGYTLNSDGTWNPSVPKQFQPIYTGNEVKQKLYGLGFLNKNDGLVLNKYGVTSDTSSDYLAFGVLSGYKDMNLTVMGSTPEVDQKIRTIFNYILPGEGDYFYDMTNKVDLKSQTLTFGGRTIWIDVEQRFISITFGPIVK